MNETRALKRFAEVVGLRLRILALSFSSFSLLGSFFFSAMAADWTERRTAAASEAAEARPHATDCGPRRLTHTYPPTRRRAGTRAHGGRTFSMLRSIWRSLPPSLRPDLSSMRSAPPLASAPSSNAATFMQS